jgi:hypothetical protein
MSDETNHIGHIARVRTLDLRVSQQVAAGEVVERTASAFSIRTSGVSAPTISSKPSRSPLAGSIVPCRRSHVAA